MHLQPLAPLSVSSWPVPEYNAQWPPSTKVPGVNQFYLSGISGICAPSVAIWCHLWPHLLLFSFPLSISTSTPGTVTNTRYIRYALSQIIPVIPDIPVFHVIPVFPLSTYRSGNSLLYSTFRMRPYITILNNTSYPTTSTIL
jgi:hypothetical protein